MGLRAGQLLDSGKKRGRGRVGREGGRGALSLVTIRLHQAVDLEPVGPPPVPGARLGHPHHQTLPQSAGLARGPVLLVHHTSVVILTLSYHRLKYVLMKVLQ